MSSALPDFVLSFISVEQTIIDPIMTLSVMYFAYGCYVLLFGTYLYMMRNRDQTGERQNRNLYLTLTVILFVLSTMFVINHTVYYVHGAVVRFNVVKDEDYDLLERYQNEDDFERRFGYSVESFVTIFLNIAAEWMLIHRCYLIWGSNKLVGIPLIVASVVINAGGLAYCILQSIGANALANQNPDALILVLISSLIDFIYNIVSAAHNLAITMLTAGRIWWIHREVRAQGVYTTDNLVQSISGIILESGIIYPVTSVIAVILANAIAPEKLSFDAAPVVAISAGFAPTLIMVRAKLGKNVESLRDAVSDIHFTSQPAQRGPIGTNTIQSEAQILSAVRNSSEFGGGEGQPGNAAATV